jgi:hypothetical protein
MIGLVVRVCVIVRAGLLAARDNGPGNRPTGPATAYTTTTTTPNQTRSTTTTKPNPTAHSKTNHPSTAYTTTAGRTAG